MTEFAWALRLLSLTAREAADLCGVSPRTVEDWRTGRRTAPQSAWDRLAGLYAAGYGLKGAAACMAAIERLRNPNNE